MYANGQRSAFSSQDVTAWRELAGRIAGSKHFRKSARQRDLLLFLCNRALDDPGCEIHEQEIGIAVFGRNADYDKAADNIIRVNIYDLRKRLETYFAVEGQAEPTVLDIPKGGYCPTFTPRAGELPAEPVSELPSTYFESHDRQLV